MTTSGGSRRGSSGLDIDAATLGVEGAFRCARTSVPAPARQGDINLDIHVSYAGNKMCSLFRSPLLHAALHPTGQNDGARFDAHVDRVRFQFRSTREFHYDVCSQLLVGSHDDPQAGSLTANLLRAASHTLTWVNSRIATPDRNSNY